MESQGFKIQYQEVRELLVAYLQPYVGDELLSNTAQPFGGRCSPDVFFQKYQLSPHQQKALTFVLEHGGLTIQNFEEICPKPSRRTLQRELRGMVEKGLLVPEGETNRLYYRLNPLQVTLATNYQRLIHNFLVRARSARALTLWSKFVINELTFKQVRPYA